MSDFVWIIILFLLFLFGIGLGGYVGVNGERIRILEDINTKIIQRDKGSHTIYEEFELIVNIIGSKDNS